MHYGTTPTQSPHRWRPWRRGGRRGGRGRAGQGVRRQRMAAATTIVRGREAITISRYHDDRAMPESWGRPTTGSSARVDVIARMAHQSLTLTHVSCEVLLSTMVATWCATTLGGVRMDYPHQVVAVLCAVPRADWPTSPCSTTSSRRSRYYFSILNWIILKMSRMSRCWKDLIHSKQIASQGLEALGVDLAAYPKVRE